MNAVVAHDGEGDSDAGEKDQGRSADQERHAQEDRRPEEDGCSAKACGTEEDRGGEGSGSEEDSGPEEAGRQESHDPEEAGRQESHNPEEDSGPEAVGNQDVRAAGCPSPSSSGAHGAHDANGGPSLIREEPTPQPAPPCRGREEAEERRLSTDFSEREEEPGKDS